MKHIRYLLLLVLLIPAIGWADFLGIKKASEVIDFEINEPLDATGLPIKPDSMHLVTRSGGTELYVASSTTWPFAAIGVDTLVQWGDTLYGFSDQIQDIDGSGGNFLMSIAVVSFGDDLPFLTSHTVQVVSDSLNMYLNHIVDSDTLEFIAANVITATSIATDAITAAKIASAAIAADEIATDAIGAAEIAANAIGASEIADNAIDAGAIATAAIGADEIATDAIGAAEVAAGAIVQGTEATGFLIVSDNIGINWADVANPTAAVNLTQTNIRDVSLNDADSVKLLAIKTATDQLNFTGTDVKATLDGEKVVVSGFDADAINAAAIAADGIAEIQNGLSTFDNTSDSVIVDVSAAATANGLVDEVQSGLSTFDNTTDSVLVDVSAAATAAGLIDEIASAVAAGSVEDSAYILDDFDGDGYVTIEDWDSLFHRFFTTASTVDSIKDTLEDMSTRLLATGFATHSQVDSLKDTVEDISTRIGGASADTASIRAAFENWPIVANAVEINDNAEAAETLAVICDPDLATDILTTSNTPTASAFKDSLWAIHASEVYNAAGDTSLVDKLLSAAAAGGGDTNSFEVEDIMDSMRVVFSDSVLNAIADANKENFKADTNQAWAATSASDLDSAVASRIVGRKIWGQAVGGAGSTDSVAVTARYVGTIAGMDANAIGSGDIASGAITASVVADGTVDSATFASNAITQYAMAPNAIGSSELDANAIGSSELAANCITSSEIADGAIDAGAIATDAITAAKLATNAITSDEIAAGAIVNGTEATGFLGSTALDSVNNAITATNKANFKATGFSTFNVASDKVTLVDSSALHLHDIIDSLNNQIWASVGTGVPDSVAAGIHDILDSLANQAWASIFSMPDSIPAGIHDILDTLANQIWASTGGTATIDGDTLLFYFGQIVNDSNLARYVTADDYKGGTGTGPDPLLVYVLNTADSSAISSATVSVDTKWDGAGTEYASGTNGAGLASFGLNDGDSLLIMGVATLFSTSVDSIVKASGTDVCTLWATAPVISSPSSASLTRVYGDFFTGNGDTLANAKVHIELYGATSAIDTSINVQITATVIDTVTNSSGRFTADLYRNANLWVGTGKPSPWWRATISHSRLKGVPATIYFYIEESDTTFNLNDITKTIKYNPPY